MNLTRWQRIKRALGMAWRDQATCPHPKDRRCWAGGVNNPPDDIDCMDCGKTLFIGSPVWRWIDRGAEAEGVP